MTLEIAKCDHVLERRRRGGSWMRSQWWRGGVKEAKAKFEQLHAQNSVEGEMKKRSN